jgi:DNA-binding GntR family transcriptional regulator
MSLVALHGNTVCSTDNSKRAGSKTCGGTDGGPQSVYLELKDLVKNYQFRPGQHLHPNGLADHLRVSRTPVREALHRLAAEHLVVSAPNRGFFAKTLQVDEINELYRLQHALLLYSVENATATSWPPAQSKVTMNWPAILNRDPVADITPTSLSEALEDIWVQIATASANHSLVAIVRNLNDRTHFLRLLDLEEYDCRRCTMLHAKSLRDQLSNGQIDAARVNLGDELSRKMRMVPSLVREGLSRCYESSPMARHDPAVGYNSYIPCA